MTAVDKPMTIRFRDAGDQLQELLDTRPSEPTVEELKRWWDSSVAMLPGVLYEFGEQRKAVRRLRDDLDGARAALRREQDARAQLRVELDRLRAAGRKISEWGFGQAHAYGCGNERECDACEFTRALEQQPCCPQSTLPGSKHDIGCRAGGKVH